MSRGATFEGVRPKDDCPPSRIHPRELRRLWRVVFTLVNGETLTYYRQDEQMEELRRLLDNATRQEPPAVITMQEMSARRYIRWQAVVSVWVEPPEERESV